MGWSRKIKTSRYGYFFKRKPVIDDIQASSTGTTDEQSDQGEKNNPDLLQEDEEQ